MRYQLLTRLHPKAIMGMRWTFTMGFEVRGFKMFSRSTKISRSAVLYCGSVAQSDILHTKSGVKMAACIINPGGSFTIAIS